MVSVPIEGFNKMPLRLEQTVSSASAHEGDRVRFTLMRDLYVDGNTMAASGATFYATVTAVRPKSARRSGSLKFSQPYLDQANAQRIRLSPSNPEESAGAAAIPAYIIMGATVGPLVIASSPIWITEMIVHDVRERRLKSKAPKP